MRIHSAGAAIGEAEVASLEAKVGRRLPDDYRRFLLAHNALQIRPCVLETPELSVSEKVCLHTMTCFLPGKSADFQNRLEAFQGRIPPDMLPIASDPGGSLFLLDLAPARHGRIDYWDRDGEVEEGEEPNRENIHPLAESFGDFVARLIDD